MKRKPRPYEKTHQIINGIIYKLCSDCDKWLPLDESYYKNKSAPDGHNPYCKECTKKRSSKWIKGHPEQYKKSRLKCDEKLTSKIKKRKRDARYRKQGRQKDWQNNNADKIKEYNQDRRLHKKHKISKNEWENCKNYFNYRCAYCGLPIEEHYVQYKGKIFIGDFHKEHVDDCGSNDLSNCIPSCKSCNTTKHTYKLDEWYNESNPVFSFERLNKIIKWLSDDYKLYIQKYNN